MDHRACDEVFANVEQTVNSEGLAASRELYKEFVHAREHHFQMETVNFNVYRTTRRQLPEFTMMSGN